MPAAGTEYMYVDSSDADASTVGGLSVGVPGDLRGWETLHKRFVASTWLRILLTCLLDMELFLGKSLLLLL